MARRSFSEYGEEYKYVWSDLQRIALVSGTLTALLLVLWFVVE